MPHLSLSLLGTFEVALDGRPLTGFESAKARALLAYLAVEANRAHTRAALAGLLWPEVSEDVARTNLRQVLANLRQLLDDQRAQAPFLLITRDNVQFNRDSDQCVDVATFKDLLATCERHAHRRADTCRSCARRFTEAAALYHGSFLQGLFVRDSVDFEEWTLHQREAFHQRALATLGKLAAYHEQYGAYAEMQDYAQRQIALDPWREEAHRLLMRALLLAGQRSAALAQYERCRHVLQVELGVVPARETTALYERIRAEQELGGQPRRVPRARLPLPPTPFVGREPELAELARLIEQPDGRLITLVGPGGVGKTRLALQAATNERATFRDGVAFVPLAPVLSVELLVPAVAAALSVTLSGQTDPRVEILDYLREKELLLILDNIEHLLQSDGDPVDLLVEILEQAPGLAVIVTSRERLWLQAERVVKVQGLPYPGEEQTEGLTSYSAVELFAERACRAQSDFVLTPAEEPYVGRICRLMVGLPLGIELAAAAVGPLSCRELAQALETNLLALATVYRDVPGRHRSLRAALDQSWKSLAAAEQRSLRSVSVFRGGFEPATAVAVAGASLSSLSILVDKSLLQREPGPDEIWRFDLHEAVRQYAWEQLQAAGETDQARTLHLDIYLGLAETAEVQLRGAEQVAWLERLEREHDNLRAAFDWSIASGASTLALRLGAALWRFWQTRGHIDEGRKRLVQAFEQATDAPLPVRAQALAGMGTLAFVQGDYQASAPLHEHSLALFEQIVDERGIAFALNNVATQAHFRGNYQHAVDLVERALTLFRQLNDTWGIAFTLNNLASIAISQGDYERAARLLDESLALARQVGDDFETAIRLHNLGEVTYRLGSYERATSLLEESIIIFGKLGTTWGTAKSLQLLALIARDTDEFARAVELFRHAIELFDELGDKLGLALGLEGLASTISSIADRAGVQEATRLFGAADVLRKTIGAPIPSAEHDAYAASITGLRAQLGDAKFQVAWNEGRALPLKELLSWRESIVSSIDVGQR